MREPFLHGMKRRVFFRYAVAWLMAVMAVTAAVLVPWYRQSVALVGAEFDAAMTQELRGLEARFLDDGLAGLVAEVDWRSRDASDRDAVYLLADRELHRVAGNLQQWPSPLRQPRPGRFEIATASGGSLQGALLPIGSGHWLLAGRYSPLSAFAGQLARYVMAASVSLILATAVCAWLFGRHLSQRMQRMADEADIIRTGDLARRLSVGDQGDELDELARRFNATFADLQRSLEGVRHVSSAIAHDLRRPLIRLRQQLETAAQASDQATVFASPLQEALQAVDEALSVFSALLRLARIESGGLGQLRRVEALEVIVSDAAELHRPLALQQGRELRTTLEPARVSGDRDLLFQLVHNLIENALRHGSGCVELSVYSGERVRLSVSDEGAGVEEADFPHLGERFWRADKARSSDGSGLGLSLCQAIVEAHGGQLSFVLDRPGFRVCVDLPKAGD